MVKTPPKMTKLVVSAIKNLRDVHGSTAKDILNYVMRECNAEPSMERKLNAALKRGIDFGILKRARGHYMLNTDPELLQDSGPMERGRRRRRRRRRGRSGKSKSRRGRGRRRRRRRRGGRRKGRGRSRGGRRGRRGRSRRGRRGGRMKRHGNVDDIDMLSKEPLESSRPSVEGTGADFEHPSSRSRSRNSRSRSHTPSHSQSSLSSDREGVDGNPQAE
ncbi:serine/arginine repetitive matrix protein 2 [Diachasma alloeum]|uniref:serine/arginine repetitive matrix protein 2 n=1 Tax=Diachasma alloeum TaxID=454923 RepID=UPI0007381663|nr:serine/arginine repetitive matrix protein 2 [Diachasma alloeum]